MADTLKENVALAFEQCNRLSAENAELREKLAAAEQRVKDWFDAATLYATPAALKEGLQALHARVRELEAGVDKAYRDLQTEHARAERAEAALAEAQAGAKLGSVHAHTAGLPRQQPSTIIESQALREQAGSEPDMHGTTLNGFADMLCERAPQMVNSADGALAVQAASIIRWLATKITQQAGAEPVASVRVYLNGIVGMSSNPAQLALLRTMDNADLYAAPPSLDLAVALAVEKCAKFCDPVIDDEKAYDSHIYSCLKGCAAAIRAIAPTLSTDVRRVIEDSERWQKAIAVGFPVRNQSPHSDNVRWTIEGKWFGSTPTECIDAARGKG